MIDTWPKRSILTDTGRLYATVDPNDEHHDRARAEALQLDREGIVVLLSAPVLLEAYSLTLNRLGITQAHAWVTQALTGTSLVNPTPEMYERAGLRIRRYLGQTITLTDATLAELSEHLTFPVWTFDHHFDVMRVQVWR